MKGLSVVVPAHNPSAAELSALVASLCDQTFQDFEVIFVDDGSTDRSAYALLEDPRFTVEFSVPQRGPASCRNLGAAAARHDALFFTDADCVLGPETLQTAAAALERDEASAGNTVTRVESRFGKAVALLGFPGGGILGFDRVWRVDDDGYAQSFSSCNLAIRRSAFDALAGFDEDIPVAGGEDTVLAHRLLAAGYRIRYTPEQVVHHGERGDLSEFVRWQRVRGRGNYHIGQRVPHVAPFLRLRAWSFGNSLRAAGPLYAPFVCALYGVAALAQTAGFLEEKRRARSRL